MQDEDTDGVMKKKSYTEEEKKRRIEELQVQHIHVVMCGNMGVTYGGATGTHTCSDVWRSYRYTYI